MDSSPWLGYYQYHAVPGNSTQLRIFRCRVCWLWRSVLIRRSQCAQLRWDRLYPLLNRWIPRLREKHGLTQEDMRDYGFAYRYYQRIEAGEKDLRLSTLNRLALAFKLPLRDLFDFD
jgi:hypothetical protein